MKGFMRSCGRSRFWDPADCLISLEFDVDIPQICTRRDPRDTCLSCYLTYCILGEHEDVLRAAVAGRRVMMNTGALQQG